MFDIKFETQKKKNPRIIILNNIQKNDEYFQIEFKNEKLSMGLTTPKQGRTLRMTCIPEVL